MKHWQHIVIQLVAMFGIFHIAVNGGTTNIGTSIVLIICVSTVGISNYARGLNNGIKIVFDWIKEGSNGSK